MANYCTNCGAYVPDGQTVCPACGTDQRVPAASSPIVAQQIPNPDSKPHSTSQNTGGKPTAEVHPDQSAGTNALSSKSGLWSLLSYVGAGTGIPVFIIPFIICKGDDFAMFHAKQSFILWALSVIVAIVLVRPSHGISLIINIALWYFAIKGILNVLAGKKEQLPYIGKLADRF